MADFDIKIVASQELLMARLTARIQTLLPGSLKFRETMYRMALLLEGQTKLNIRAERLIDTGRLLNSIRGRVEREGDKTVITVGSQGVPYAAMYEFGFDGQIRIKSPYQMRLDHYWSYKLPAEVTVTVPPHARRRKVMARPYLNPALEKHKPTLIHALRNLAEFGDL